MGMTTTYDAVIIGAGHGAGDAAEHSWVAVNALFLYSA